jgi:hypothetical protein
MGASKVSMNDITLVKKIAAISVQFLAALESKDIKSFVNTLSTYADLKKQLITQTIESGIIITNSVEERNLLRMVVRNDNSFPLNTALDNLSEFTKESDSASEPFELITNLDLEELSEEYFYSWYSGWSYVETLIDLGSVVVNAEMDDHLHIFVSDIRNSYAFQQYHGVAVLCRTLLEASIRSIGLKTERLSQAIDKQQLYDDYPPKKMIHTVLKGTLANKIYRFYRDLCEVVHGFRIVRREESLEIMKRTFAYVEQMWDYNFNKEK